MYSREFPSLRYQELISQYVRLHLEGDLIRSEAPEQVYAGKRVLMFALEVKAWVQKFGVKSLLDYGSGKGCFYQDSPYFGVAQKSSFTKKHGSLNAYWGLERIVCYDPALPFFAKYPEGTFEGVICIDVLEHCPEEDLPWIIDELFSYAERFVFMTVALSPALRTLPKGENAHCTIKSISWWETCFRDASKKTKEQGKKVSWKLIFETFSLGKKKWIRKKEIEEIVI